MLKILSTKTLSAPLLEKAKGHGLEITGYPFITINPVTGPQTESEIRHWLTKKEPFFAVFTSANAVAAVTAHIKPEYARPRWSVFCISGRTRESLAPYIDPANILETAEYGKELAQKILTHPIKELVFFCGNRRRDELPGLLREKGITVHEIVVYHTRETPVRLTAAATVHTAEETRNRQEMAVETAGRDTAGNDAFGNDPDGILFFSPSAVDSFFSLNTLVPKTICFAIGRTTADSIAQHTSNKIITSRSTSQETMIDTVQEYFQNNKGK